MLFNCGDVGGYCAANLPFLKYQRSEELLLRLMELKCLHHCISDHEEASHKGLTVCHHLLLHYPDDEHGHSLTYEQFLVGTEILVVFVLEKGKKNVKAYFPVGERYPWKHIWTGNLYKEQGSEARVGAPIGYPAIFIKDGSVMERPL